MEWLFGFTIALTMCAPTDSAFAQQTVKERDTQRAAQQADRGPTTRIQGRLGKGQPGKGRGGQGGGGHGRGGQGSGGLFRLLDADRDGKLSAKEIDRAIAVLMKLDRNRDGVLDTEELAGASRGRGGGQRGKGAEGRDKQRRNKQGENEQ